MWKKKNKTGNENFFNKKKTTKFSLQLKQCMQIANIILQFENNNDNNHLAVVIIYTHAIGLRFSGTVFGVGFLTIWIVVKSVKCRCSIKL